MIQMKISEPKIIKMKLENIRQITNGGTDNHNELKNLDFENSGHTGFQPAGDYALKNDIPTKVSQLENDENYLTSIPDEYITNEELENKGYLTNVPDEYATKQYVDDVIGNIVNGNEVEY